MTIRQGFVGCKLASGEIVRTLSGRYTTPFPKFSKITASLFKKVDKWLIQNAYDEAVSRGDDFNATIFKQDIDCKSIPTASKDAAEMYLFEYQPMVPRPFTRELV
jgi:hypothetical protein